MPSDLRLTDRGARVVVVGSGLSGLAVANALVDAGLRDVLVLEAGRATRNATPSPDVRASPLWSTLRPPHYAPPGRDSPESAWPGLGGRSLYWHGVLLPIEDYALRDPRWPAEVRARLAGGEGAGSYADTIAAIERWAREDDCAPVSADRADAAFADWLATSTGCPARPVPQAVRQHADGRREVFTPLHRFARTCAETQGGTGPRVLTGMRVDALAHAGGRLLGVHAQSDDGARRLVEADAVVLAAGTIENTRLVGQLSDVPPTYEGLNDHLTQGFLVPIPRTRLPPELHDGAFSLLMRSESDRANVFARLRPLDGTASLLLDVWALGEQLPSDENHVRVLPGMRPGVQVRAGLSPADRHVLAGGAQRLADAWQAIARQLGLPHHPLRFGDFLAADRPFHAARGAVVRDDVDTPITYTWPLGAGDHESGTLPLGRVLDADGRVPGLDSVFVAGPAVFPRSGAANPSLTTLALARRTAQAIVGQLMQLHVTSPADVRSMPRSGA